jgi:hypothetical protein
MITWFKEGGFSMWFLLVLGIVAVASAFWFAVKPGESHYRVLKWMAVSILFAMLCGLTSGAAITFHVVASMEDATHEMRMRIVIEGLGETLTNGVLGSALLMVTALFVAVGRRRLDSGHPGLKSGAANTI